MPCRGFAVSYAAFPTVQGYMKFLTIRPHEEENRRPTMVWDFLLFFALACNNGKGTLGYRLVQLSPTKWPHPPRGNTPLKVKPSMA